MGVGVYSNDFEGTGATFIVSPGFYLTREEYEAYKVGCAGDGSEPVDFETWASDEQDQFAEDIRAGMEAALGCLSDPFDASASRARFDADSGFTSMFGGGDFEIGIRNWESDYVVAIAPSGSAVRSLISYGEDYDGESVAETGMGLEVLRASYASRLEALRGLLVQSVMGNGLDCRYRTSGWTTAAYGKDADPEQAAAERIAAFDDRAPVSVSTPAPAMAP